MAETLDSADALKMTTSTSRSHEFLPSPNLHSPNGGEIEEVLLDDTNNNQKSSALLLKKPECCFSGYQQDSEVDTETLKTAVFRDSPSGDVAYDSALVSTDVVFPDIQEPPSSCVAMFADDATDSRNEKNREEKFADDSIDSRAVTKQEGNFADDAIAPRTVTRQEGHFSDDAIISSTVNKQEDDFADDGIDSRTVTKQGHFADDAIDSSTVKKQGGVFADYAIVSSTVKKQEGNFSHAGIDSRTVTKQERKFSDYAICSSTVTKQGGKFADDGVDSRTVTKLEGKFSDDVICSRTVKKQEKFESLKCALKIQVIDETALIELPCLGNGTFNNGKRQKTQGTKEKRPKRRISKAEKKVETSGTRSQDCGYIGNKGKKRLVYSRKEVEALRFVGLEAQKNKWIEVYCGLGPLVAKEYDELSHHQKHNATGFDFDPRNQFLRASVPPRYLDAVAARTEGNHLKVSVR
ncbi:unnamed protein product [Fraxinus pennsylvanica]|uniref:Uncharacterized protein n=1 Tax=Fraxinus pennsylvanica TaxID=56036 RepID=A0AAD1ZJY1_9LAMI|nr:unnamed protein product [Fraxinus pennsylvanica]